MMPAAGSPSPGGAGEPCARPLFHVVLHEPEIPNNTGNIGRTCIAAGCALHLIHPLGFDTSEKALRRAGLDYWPRVRVREHADWPAYTAWMARASSERESRDVRTSGEHAGREAVRWFTSGHGGTPFWEADLRRGDELVFGKETRGLPEELLTEARAQGRVLHMPMVPGERGLNLATVVCAVVWEGVRQCVARGDVRLDEAGRLVLGGA
jgi:tRNA (cytidine/uridine-2'-O-)-methyltransferase